MDVGLESVDVVILAGGLGTRIRSVLGETPKVLAPISGRTFLDFLLEWLKGMGARRVIFCLGFGAAQVQNHLQAQPLPGMELITVVEPEPLGTAGAIRFARSHFRSDPVMILNGDTFITTDLRDFLAEHHSAGSQLSLLCVQVSSTARFGRVELNADGWIQRMLEKSQDQTGPGLINGGMYLFSTATLDRLAESKGSSLERDFFSNLPENTLRGIVRQAHFIDIGVPESLHQAGEFFKRAVQNQKLNPGSSPPSDIQT